METGRFGPNGFAEQHDHAELIWVDAEGEGVEGYDGRDCHGDQEQERAWETSATWHHLLELVLAALKYLFEVRMQRGTTVSFTAAIAQRHDLVLSMGRLWAPQTLASSK